MMKLKKIFSALEGLNITFPSQQLGSVESSLLDLSSTLFVTNGL